MKKNIHILFLITLISLPAYSQTGFYPDKSLGVAVSADAFAGLEISYNKRIEWYGKMSQIAFNVKTPVILNLLNKSPDAFESDISFENQLISTKNFIFLWQARAGLGYHKQVLGVFYPVNVSLKITPALKTSTGYWGITTAFRQTVTNYIVFSDYAKNRYDDIYDSSGNLITQQPENGFYPFTGHRVDLGIAGRLSVLKKDYLYIEAGYSDFLSEYTGALNAMMYGQLPFFMKIKYEITLR